MRISEHALGQWQDHLQNILDAKIPESVRDKSDAEIRELLAEIPRVRKGRGKRDAIDREYGTFSVGPTKTFGIRIRYAYREGDDYPTVGSIASNWKLPDIRI